MDSNKKPLLLRIFIFSKLIILLLIIVLIVSVAWRLKEQKKPEFVNIEINNKIIKSELVSKPIDLFHGLSDRKYLEQDGGMLFSFKESEIREFVMRRMNFPLDIIFINNQQIINIAKNLAPENDNPKNIYNSGSPADLVLEVNAGYTEKNNLKIGDKISIKQYEGNKH